MPERRRCLAPLAVLLILAASSLAGAWERLPLEGGEVRAIAIDPVRPLTLYLGTGGGEIYRSSDGGESWEPPRPGVPFPGFVLDSLSFDPGDPERLWLAGWGLWGAGVVADSRDGGLTWTRRDRGIEEKSPRALAVGVTATGGRVLYVGALDGVWMSRDEGESWRLVSAGVPGLVQVESLAIDPRDTDIVYAGTWRRAYKSFDGGSTWCSIHGGMVLDSDVFEIAPDPGNGQDLWAATCGWVYRSRDGGDSWVRHTDGFKNRRVQAVERIPGSSLDVLAGSCGGIYRSFDGGLRWWLMGREDLVVKTVKVDPRNPARVYVGTEGDGFHLSTDGGINFEPRNRGLFATRVADLLVDGKRRLWAARSGSGAANGVYVSRDGGRAWKRRGGAELPEPLVLGEALEAIWLGTVDGLWFTTDTGKTWTRAGGPRGRVGGLANLGEHRLVAATSEGVWTATEPKAWKRLGDMSQPVAKVAAGWWKGKRAVFAAGKAGLWVFADGAWEGLAEGSSLWELAVLTPAGAASSTVFVGGVRGIRARSGPEKPWQELRDAERDTMIALLAESGEDRAAIIDRSGRRLRLFDASLRETRGLDLPYEARQVRALALSPDGSRVLLATIGYGLFSHSWDLPLGPLPVAGTATARQAASDVRPQRSPLASPSRP